MHSYSTQLLMYLQAEKEQGRTEMCWCVLLIFFRGILSSCAAFHRSRIRASLQVCAFENEKLWILIHLMQMPSQVEASVTRSDFVLGSQMPLCLNH